MATKDAIFQIDVGNVTIDAVRFLKMNDQQAFTTSGWYATMDYALPAAIDLKQPTPTVRFSPFQEMVVGP